MRIDPTEGLIRYVNAAKPYHTKLLDVLVEYVYTDKVSVTVKDNLSWVIEFLRPNTDVVYSCGYGLVWDQQSTAENNIRAPIISALADSAPGNSFLIQPQVGQSYGICVINPTAGLFNFADTFTILSADFTTQQWVVASDVTSLISIGQFIYVNNNGTASANGKYTVNNVSLIGSSTHITVVETIHPLVQNNGQLNIPFAYDKLPAWIAGTQIKLSSTGLIPSPITSDTECYFAPTTTPGVFNLAYKSYPTKYEDFVKITTTGTGNISAHRSETFFPGATVIVSNSFHPRNDGTYTIMKTVAEGNNVRVFVREKVQFSSPVGSILDGVMTYHVDGYDAPAYCELAQAPDMYVEAYVHESFTIEYAFNFNDSVQAQVSEFRITGYGDTPFSSVNLSPFGDAVDSSMLSTPLMSGYTILPHGVDAQMFDVGGIDESISTNQVKNK